MYCQEMKQKEGKIKDLDKKYSDKIVKTKNIYKVIKKPVAD